MAASHRSAEDWAFHGVKGLVVLFLMGLTLLPFLYALSVSFRTPGGFYGAPVWIPSEITLEPWGRAIDGLSEPLKNSALIATGTAILSLVITIPGAYVFGRKEFPGKEIAFYLVILALLFPYILLVIPITDLWYQYNLHNTMIGLILAYQVFVTPFAVWILRDFFEKLPANLEEAAQVYGCTQFQAFYKVILPLSAPAVMATGFLAFLVGWNDFLFSNMLTTGTGPRPAVVALYLQTVGGETTYWGLIMAMALIVGTPPTVLYLFARRYLTESFAV
jgi:ABC-type glycerol-3-phosphate transport system permease component